jgi:hypothetical protein
VATEWEDCWASAAWRADVTAWVDAALAEHGRVRNGSLAVHKSRMWAVTLTATTDRGRVWFKENCPGQWAEASVVAALAAAVPEHVVGPLAVDVDRGWLLSPDQGPTLAEHGAATVETWVRVVTDYAGFQRATVPHGAALAAAGLRTVDPASAASYLAREVDRLAAMPPGHPRQLDGELVTRLVGLLPMMAGIGELLAAGAVPLCLEHNDLHHHNAFAPGDDEGPRTPLRWFDFGDALWGHPFASLLVLLNVVAREGGLEADDPALRVVADAYLECWTDLAPRTELQPLLEAALVLGRLHRYVSWDRCLQGAEPEDMGEHGEAPGVWLATLANALESYREKAVTWHG